MGQGTLPRPTAAALALLAVPLPAHAAAPAGVAAEAFLWIALILLFAKAASLVERFGLPAVLGELLIGMVLGNLALTGLDFAEPAAHNPILEFLAQLGVVILLFQIGLESDIQGMRRVGLRAALVALIGVALPFVLGAYLAGPLLLPGLGQNAYLFLGAALVATSVGITGRVFRDAGMLQSPAAQTVMGAAVIDDVLGLIILAVVSALAEQGSVSAGEVLRIVGESVAFLVGALVLGQPLAPVLSRWFAKIHRGPGMKFTFLISFCLIFAYLASLIGLAPIIGAFSAGVVLKRVHFQYFDDPAVVEEVRAALASAGKETRERVERTLEAHAHHHLEHLVEPVAYMFVPIFFVLTGMQVRLDALFDLGTLAGALAVTAVAVAGKVAAGVAAARGTRWLVGWGMVPRGEVGLIFAAVGRDLGVVPENLFSVIVVMVILTTLIAPPVLGLLLGRRQARP